MNVYERIGQDKITAIIQDFYAQAFVDPIIGYFFDGKNQDHLIQQQVSFTIGMLGGPKNYTGKPLELAHRSLNLRPAHFNRRKILMEETMQRHNIDKSCQEEWLMLEEQFRRIIVNIKEACL
jgi:hemoglobin